MNTEDILLEIIDLSFAIKDDDLETAIIKVDNINNYLDQTSITSDQLKELLGLIGDYDRLILNDTFYYILSNLTHLTNSKEIVTEIRVMELIKNYNQTQSTSEIKKFIEENLPNAFSDFDYKILIKLTNIIQDFDLLYLIKETMQEKRDS